MDFGFERFLEMFEDRFGRHATTALIGTVGIALFLYALHVIIDVVKELNESLERFDWTHNSFVIGILSQTVGVLFGFLLLLLFFGTVYNFYFTPKTDRLREEIKANAKAIQTARDLSLKFRAEAEQNLAEITAKAAGIEKQIAALKARDDNSQH